MSALLGRSAGSAGQTPDLDLMAAVVALSSSTPAREVAAAWLAAYDTASAMGVCQDEAEARAHEAYRRAAARLRLPLASDAGAAAA